MTDKEVDKIMGPIRKLKKNSVFDESHITLLQLDKFLLPAIFLMEPVTKSSLVKIVKSALGDDKNAITSTNTSISILTKKRYIELTTNGYVLTQLGNMEFLSFRKQNKRNKQPERALAIDDLRLEILNLKYRNKKMKV